MGTSHSSYYFGRRKEQERKDLDAFLFSSVFIFPFWQVVKFEAWIDQSINQSIIINVNVNVKKDM